MVDGRGKVHEESPESSCHSMSVKCHKATERLL